MYVSITKVQSFPWITIQPSFRYHWNNGTINTNNLLDGSIIWPEINLKIGNNKGAMNHSTKASAR